jgi:hypothetical protein
MLRGAATLSIMTVSIMTISIIIVSLMASIVNYDCNCSFYSTDHNPYDHKLHITIVNYDHKTFIVEATAVSK